MNSWNIHTSSNCISVFWIKLINQSYCFMLELCLSVSFSLYCHALCTVAKHNMCVQLCMLYIWSIYMHRIMVFEVMELVACRIMVYAKVDKICVFVKVFLQPIALSLLNDEREEILTVWIEKLQTICRGWLGRKRLEKLKVLRPI